MFYHEDDYCQVQLLPFENTGHLSAQAEHINGFAKEQSNGVSLQNTYVGSDEHYHLAERGILTGEMDQLLAKALLMRTEKVVTGYGQSFREQSHNTVAHGEDSACILYDFEGDVLQHIWLIYHFDTNEIFREKFKTALYYLGYRWNLVLMDWNQLRLVDIQRKSALEKYLNGDGMNLHL